MHYYLSMKHKTVDMMKGFFFFFFFWMEGVSSASASNSQWVFDTDRSLPFAELFKRWPDHTPALDDAVPANSDVSQIPSDDAVVHHYGLIRDRKAC